MGDYSQAAEFYDLLYSGEKDYDAEAKLLVELIQGSAHDATSAAAPAVSHATPAASLLDVGCGTGAHAQSLIDAGFEVDGVDLEPAFVEIARAKCPEGSFHVGDMRTLDLPDRYDAVLCLFSAIGYVRDEAALTATIERMRAHLKPGGVLIVDPWFEPGQLTSGRISTIVGEGDGITVWRMSRTVIDGAVSRLEFEYVIGTADGIERRSEVHELGLFTQEQMEAAFASAGLSVERRPKALRTRGIYLGRSP